MREGEKKIGGGDVVDVCLGREEKGTVLSVYPCLQGVFLGGWWTNRPNQNLIEQHCFSVAIPCLVLS